jgi:Ca-activated chloride channel family protein
VLQYGENVFYRVHLAWGQAVAWQVGYGHPADERRTVNIEAKTFTPARQEVDYDTTAYVGGADNHLPGSRSDNHPDAAFATYPVEYQNRTVGNNGSLQAESIDGWYYLSVKLGYGTGGTAPGGGNVPVTLDVSVVGDPQPGPHYDGQAGSAVQIFGADGTPGAAGTTQAPSSAAGTATTTMSTTTGSGTGTASASTPPVGVGLAGARSKRSDDGLPWALFVLIPVALAGSVATAVFLRKARRSS